MKVHFEPATLAHAEHLAAHARQADIDELWACARATPLQTMVDGMTRGNAVTGFIDDEPVSLFGVAPYSLLSGIGTPWMVCSDRIATRKGRLATAQTCHKIMAWMQAQAPSLLYNVVDERNAVAQCLLKKLGFTLMQTIPVGPDNTPFRVFYWRAP